MDISFNQEIYQLVILENQQMKKIFQDAPKDVMEKQSAARLNTPQKNRGATWIKIVHQQNQYTGTIISALKVILHTEIKRN